MSLGLRGEMFTSALRSIAPLHELSLCTSLARGELRQGTTWGEGERLPCPRCGCLQLQGAAGEPKCGLCRALLGAMNLSKEKGEGRKRSELSLQTHLSPAPGVRHTVALPSARAEASKRAASKQEGAAPNEAR